MKEEKGKEKEGKSEKQEKVDRKKEKQMKQEQQQDEVGTSFVVQTIWSILYTDYIKSDGDFTVNVDKM